MSEHGVHPAGVIDDVDPHHESHHHGHVIMRPSTLVGVLLALLVLTGVTVGAAQFESWVAHTWHLQIPSLFNACVAMSIAVVKAILVFMFFMQLKYDSPLNSILMGFCFFAVGLFLFFSMIDLGNRGVLYQYKSGEVQLGGQGIVTAVDRKGPDGKPLKDAQGNTLTTGINTNNKPIVEWARLRRIEEIGILAAQAKLDPPLHPGETPEERYLVEKAEAHAHARGGHHATGPALSDASKSRAPATAGAALYATPTTEKPAGGHGGH